MKLKLMIASMVVAASAMAQPDPNFHIYLCLGQSNMEGNAKIENVDKNDVPEAFQMMACDNFSSPKREIGNWYVATPPLVRQWTGLTPVDWFGRTMVANQPDVRVGVAVVAVAGCKIEHLDKDFDEADLAGEADWFKNIMAAYDNHPYQRLLECAQIAQESGVIKGILLHQGESNTGQNDWPDKVKKVYNDLLSDLDLEAEDVPLLVGEVVTSDMGGICGWHNTVIAKIGNTIPTAHVISAEGLEHGGDGLHFSAKSYRVLGARYATKMLELMGISNPVIPSEASGIADISADTDIDYNDAVYNMQGMRIMEHATKEALDNLPKGIYVINHKKVIK